MSSQRLRQIAAILLTAIASIFIASIVDASPSGAANDLTFNPIAPCAIFDTRNGLGGTTGPQGNGSITTFAVAGTGTCAAVPAGAAAVEINLVAVSPTGNGNLRVSANGVVPGGGVVNFTTGVTNSNALPVETNNNQIDVHVNNGPAHIRGVMLGYYTTDLQTQVNTLQTQVNDLQTLLAGVSRTTVDGYDTLRLTTVNLQLVDGTNSTYSNQNGYGNLIIGYNVNNSNTRVGSHNLIVGDSHSYSRNGTVIFGFGNATYATASSITGGQNNTTTGDGSSVSGGNANTASSSFSSVSGGVNNTASAFFSSVTGGRSNVASGLYSSVSGGSTRSSTSDDDWRAGSLFEDF